MIFSNPIRAALSGVGFVLAIIAMYLLMLLALLLLNPVSWIAAIFIFLVWRMTS